MAMPTAMTLTALAMLGWLKLAFTARAIKMAEGATFCACPCPRSTGDGTDAALSMALTLTLALTVSAGAARSPRRDGKGTEGRAVGAATPQRGTTQTGASR